MGTRKLMLAMRLVGLGWYIALCIVVGVGGGIWLDNRLKTLPLFTLLGVLLGSILAFYGVYKMVVPLVAGDNNKANSKDG
ncbi:MAG: AtpZ/AtpI family protein [Chloroflexi bacterium]|nr:AtpZ/AtpI family protein [Chloroflexota bacterium]